MVRENLKEVEEHIQEACRASGRSRDEVTLIAVSKTKPVSMLMEAYDSGIRVFGENKVQELCDKYEEMPKDIQWHMLIDQLPHCLENHPMLLTIEAIRRKLIDGIIDAVRFNQQRTEDSLFDIKSLRRLIPHLKP